MIPPGCRGLQPRPFGHTSSVARTAGPLTHGEAAIEALLRLRPVPTSAGSARRFVTLTLTDWGCAAIVDAVTLLVSEVVTNAILHARSDIELHISGPGPALRVEVWDSSPAEPTMRRQDKDATSGRGLAIVDVLASAWGVTHRAGGKLVWFEVAAA